MLALFSIQNRPVSGVYLMAVMLLKPWPLSNFTFTLKRLSTRQIVLEFGVHAPGGGCVVRKERRRSNEREKAPSTVSHSRSHPAAGSTQAEPHDPYSWPTILPSPSIIAEPELPP